MKRIYIPLILALAATACQDNAVEPILPVDDGIMRINIVGPGVQTKVSSGTFEAEDQIGLYVTDYTNETTPMPLQISGNRANNMMVAFDGTAWTPERTVYWGDCKSDVYAYYPYISEIEDVNYQFVPVAADQSVEGEGETLGGYETSDFLWAKASGVSQTGGAVNLAMSHIMSKLTVKIVAGEDYVGSLPEDATVDLHSTVTGARIDLETGSVVKDPYSGAKSIRMRNLGVRTSAEGVDAVVYEAIVVPQMLETSVPFLEINSKSVSYLLEDSFNFRPGVAYTYTATLNTSTTAIKVEIDCELEDWNNAGGEDSGDSGEGGNSGEGGEDDTTVYTDLSAAGTANCYLVQASGDYKFKAVIGNTDATVGNVKSVEVLWESFGTDVMPNVGDLIASASYKDGYIRFSTPEVFADGNAVIAAKNSKGVILWSWHIWCAEEGWQEHVYYNNAGTMMDRNLGATSATPGDVGALGLMYQWGRKEPFLGSSSVGSSVMAVSTGSWSIASGVSSYETEINPTTFYTGKYDSPYDFSWLSQKTIYDPCPAGWIVPDGGEDGVWARALEQSTSLYDIRDTGVNLSGILGTDEIIWYPFTGKRSCDDGHLSYSNDGYCSSRSLYKEFGHIYKYNFCYDGGGLRMDWYDYSKAGLPVRCQKDK